MLVSIIKLVCEIALLALVGRFVLGLLAGQKCESNVFFKLLDVMAQPFIKGARLITPKAILDRHTPLVAFLLMSLLWIVSVIEKVRICGEIGVQLCK